MIRSLLFASALVWAAPLAALDLTNMTAQERAAFNEQIRSYLLENPEIILEAVNLLEERQAQAQAQADFTLVEDNKDAIFNDPRSWVGGNPEGDITLVEFLDYRCGFCRRAMPEVADLLASDGNIRLIIKEFPILGESSVIMSRFALATRDVAGPEAYKDMHDALMELNGDPSDVALRRLAEGMGLDADAILAQMESPAVGEELQDNYDLAQALNIQGTPSFVLQDELLRGFLTADEMKERVAQKRAQ